MPTGYTAAIKDGISFEAFVMQCARAFGALVTMRDDGLQVPIPQKLEPSTYYRDALERDSAELLALDGLSVPDAQRRAEAERENRIAEAERYIRESDELQRKYEVMLVQVQAWTPPTKDHTELKKFMVQQIQESMKFDCGAEWSRAELAKAKAEKPDGEAWLLRERARLMRRIASDQEEWGKELARTNERNEWIEALRDSLAPVATN